MIGPARVDPRRHPFLDVPAPVAIAHRGGAEEAPENTLEAFGAAVAMGYRFLETDAHVTRDGVVVAFHDPCLDGLTDRRGAIASLPIAQVEAADAGFAFSLDGGRGFPFRGRGVRVPRLETLLLRWPDARVNIDPKDDACVEPLVALLDGLDAWDRVNVGSFSDRRLRRIRALSAVGRARRWGRVPSPWRAPERWSAGCPARAPTASRCRSASAGSGSSPAASCRRLIAPVCPYTSGPSTIPRRCVSCSSSGSTAS